MVSNLTIPKTSLDKLFARTVWGFLNERKFRDADIRCRQAALQGASGATRPHMICPQYRCAIPRRLIRRRVTELYGAQWRRRWRGCREDGFWQYRAEQAKNCPRRGSAAARSERPARGTGAVCGASQGSCESAAGAGGGAFVAAAPLCASSRAFVLYRAMR